MKRAHHALRRRHARRRSRRPIARIRRSRARRRRCTCRRFRSSGCPTACRCGSSRCTRCRWRRSTSSCSAAPPTTRPASTASRAWRPPCSKKAPDRDRRSRSPTRSTTSAPTWRLRAASIRPSCGCTCRSRGSPTRCRSWPTSRCGRRSRKTSSSGSAAAAHQPAAGPRRSADDFVRRLLAHPLRQGTPLRHAADGHRRDDQDLHRRTICARSTRPRSGPRTPRCSRSATSRPTR